APTTPSLLMGAQRLLSVELERLVQRFNGALDVREWDETGDLDGGGVHDQRLDSDFSKRRERPCRNTGVGPHAGADEAHLAEILTRRPGDTEAVERPRDLLAVGHWRGEDALR